MWGRHRPYRASGTVLASVVAAHGTHRRGRILNNVVGALPCWSPGNGMTLAGAQAWVPDARNRGSRRGEGNPVRGLDAGEHESRRSLASNRGRQGPSDQVQAALARRRGFLAADAGSLAAAWDAGCFASPAGAALLRPRPSVLARLERALA